MSKRNKIEANAVLKDIDNQLKRLNNTILELSTKPKLEVEEFMELCRIRTFLKSINRVED